MKTLLLLSIIVLSGCATSPEQPDWIYGNSETYKASRYLIGRGQADVPAVARDRARADLAKIFQVNISETTKDIQSYVSSSDGAGANDQFASEISRNIETRTDQIVEGVRIAEMWQDPETNSHHALAVLDRLQIGNKLRQTTMSLDSAIESYVSQAKNSDNLLTQIGAARRALVAQLERDQYQRILTIVDRTGNAPSPHYEAPRLAADLGALLKRLRIAPNITEDPVGGLEPVVSGALARAGFLNESDPSLADYIMNAGLKISELQDNQGWHWVRGSLDMVLKQKAGNKVLGSNRWNVKASSRQKEVAYQRMLDQVAQALNNELGQVIIGFGSPD